MWTGGRVLGISVEVGVHYEAQLILFTSHCRLVPSPGKSVKLSFHLWLPDFIWWTSIFHREIWQVYWHRSCPFLLHCPKVILIDFDLTFGISSSSAVLNSAPGPTLSFHTEGLITLIAEPNSGWILCRCSHWTYWSGHGSWNGSCSLFALPVTGRLNHPECTSGERPNLP